MTALEYFLRPVISPDRPLDLAWPAQNVSPAAIGQHEFGDAVGEAVFRHLKQINAFDDQLVRFAAAELDRRVQLVPDFAGRLADFKRRRNMRELFVPASSTG